MIKVYVCKAKITTPFITRNKRIGFYKAGETFLMYLSPKGTWVTTTPLNSKTESNLVGVVHRFDAKQSFLQNMNYINVVGLIFPNNKEQLNFFIERFKRERKI